MTFSFWLDDVGACQGPPQYQGTPQPVTPGDPGSAVAKSGPVQTDTNWQDGEYFWKASYSGDDTYKPLVHQCNEPNEQTLLYPDGRLIMLTDTDDEEVAVGAPTFAKSTFDKPDEQGPARSGTVTFMLHGPDLLSTERA